MFRAYVLRVCLQLSLERKYRTTALDLRTERCCACKKNKNDDDDFASIVRLHLTQMMAWISCKTFGRSPFLHIQGILCAAKPLFLVPGSAFPSFSVWRPAKEYKSGT